MSDNNNIIIKIILYLYRLKLFSAHNVLLSIKDLSKIYTIEYKRKKATYINKIKC